MCPLLAVNRVVMLGDCTLYSVACSVSRSWDIVHRLKVFDVSRISGIRNVHK